MENHLYKADHHHNLVYKTNEQSYNVQSDTSWLLWNFCMLIELLLNIVFLNYNTTHHLKNLFAYCLFLTSAYTCMRSAQKHSDLESNFTSC